ncbi:hypothetical protein HOLleu_16515 [Holothuria leucospilota]|uniref:C2H2-type domain-containing protein n=1 Tax=Holothuria leucospilota TaxID=206669 RepID=A0A9Q1C6U2_HOLLE|nr:hypothetical protein HOLleu_16515 [Holothuria leucospilota]
MPIRYRMEFMTQFWRNSVALSSDTMNKLCIGTLAVSRYHQLRRYFPVNDTPDYLDHDFPVGNGYKITPVGYMFLQPDKPSELTRDERGDYHFSFPRTGPLYMVNRVQKQSPLTIECHVNDLLTILKEEVSQGKTMVTLLTDNGPDWNVKSWTVLFFVLRIFKELNLDYSCLTSYAPGQSAYNPIEHAWSPLSRKLSGVTFPACAEGETVPPCNQTGLSEVEVAEKEKVIFTNAIESLNHFWNDMEFDGFPVRSSGVSTEQKFNDYELIHNLLSKGSKSMFRDHPDVLEGLRFISVHGDRQPGEFSIRKCTSRLCDYCLAHPIKATEALGLLESIGGVPNPFPNGSIDGAFASYMEAAQVQRVPSSVNLPPTKTSFLGSCSKCSGYMYMSRVDKLRHDAIVHGSHKRTQPKLNIRSPSKVSRR